MYVDEEAKDLGANVRQKAKDITNLLQDDDRLRRDRRSYVTPISLASDGVPGVDLYCAIYQEGRHEGPHARFHCRVWFTG